MNSPWWKIEWFKRLYPSPAPPYPDPVVSSRDGVLPDQIPSPVLRLARLAEAQGWQTLVQYAHGWEQHATHGRPGSAPKESFAVRMARGTEGACAVYVRRSSSWTWDTMFTWSQDQFWTRAKTLGALEGKLGAEP